MRTRSNQASTNNVSSSPSFKKIAAMTGVVTVCSAALAGACGDPSPTTTSGAGGTGMMSSSSGGGMGTGGENLSIVAGSVSIGSGSGSSSSGQPPPKCTIKEPAGGPTNFARVYGDTDFQTGAAIAQDKSGNIVMAGSFRGSITIDTKTLTSAGDDDLFIAKFSPAGTLMWANSFGDAKVQNASGVGLDANGNVYVAGNFKGTINLGGGPLTSGGPLYADIFLAKFGADGTHVWSQKFGDDNVQNVQGLATDAAGNVHIVGFFQNSVSFGAGTLTSAGLYDMFVAKLNTAGQHQWSKGFGDATADQYARAVTVDATSNVYVAGEVSGSIDLGGGMLTATAKPSAFVAKFDSTGNNLWHKLSAGDLMSKAHADAIAVGPNGAVAVGGGFEGKFDFGGTPANNMAVDDAFVTLFSSTGTHTYTKIFGDGQAQATTAVAIAPNGDVFAAGDFSGSIDLETGTPTMSAGSFDGFLARLDSKGCPVWLRTYPGAMLQVTEAMVLDPATGGVTLTGSVSGSVDLGAGMVMAAGNDVFLQSVKP